MMKEAMVIFSTNKHENLGVGTFEAMMLGVYPMLPNKLSYKEMYTADYKYPTVIDMYDPEMAIRHLAVRRMLENLKVMSINEKLLKQ